MNVLIVLLLSLLRSPRPDVARDEILLEVRSTKSQAVSMSFWVHDRNGLLNESTPLMTKRLDTLFVTTPARLRLAKRDGEITIGAVSETMWLDLRVHVSGGPDIAAQGPTLTVRQGAGRIAVYGRPRS
jgi:hypothetical protein